ncbi:MAG: hypothetical protein ACM3QZ_03300 [Solirubrobacterales bacterium]
MSFPTIPNVIPSIRVNGEQAVNLLLASIAFEELGLAHIINAEAEKIQFVLGTLAGQATPAPPTLAGILSIDESVNRTLRTVIKHQMLLQFKLEDLLNFSPGSATTTTTASTTTTTQTTTTTTTETTTLTTTETTTATTQTTTTTTAQQLCAPGLTFAVFANSNFEVSSHSVIDSNIQVNGNMTVTESGNTFLGNTNVVASFADSGGNTYQHLTLNAAIVPFKVFDRVCLQEDADLIVNNDVDIMNAADAAIFQGRTVWVNGTVSITAENLSIAGGGILARDGITVSGANFSYASTGCFALFSETGDVRINNGPYQITGLVYTADTGGDVRLAASQGGSICGAAVAGRDVIFTGENAVHNITNTGVCSPCLLCNDLCPG